MRTKTASDPNEQGSETSTLLSLAGDNEIDPTFVDIVLPAGEREAAEIWVGEESAEDGLAASFGLRLRYQAGEGDNGP